MQTPSRNLLGTSKALRLALIVTLFSTAALAVDPVLPFSAKLADKQGVPLDGPQTVTFRIYTESAGGNPVWTEVHNAANASKGVLSVNLGSVSGFGDLELTEGYWLGISVAGDAEMTPRVQIPAQVIIPAGTIAPFGGDASRVPKGWFLCDGRVLNSASYPRLNKAIGKAWGSSSATTFRVPDLRGLFLRGTDYEAGRDPDSAARTALLAGGNTGNKVGSVQEDEFKSHKHYLKWFREYPNNGNDVIFVTSWHQGLAGSDYTEATGGNETRPKNAYVNYIIKY